MRSRSSFVLATAFGLFAGAQAPAHAQLRDLVKKAVDEILGGTQAGPPGVEAVVDPQAAGGMAPLGVDPKETLLGPLGPGGPNSVFISDDGERVLIAAERGSRKVMLLDGVEGPVFEDVGGVYLGWTVAFSESGGRSAYLGRRGEDYVAVVDGEEVGTIFYARNPFLPTSAGNRPNTIFHFNQEGSRLAYPSKSAQGEWRMVVDGEPGPAFAGIDIGQVRVRGDRVAYVGTTADRKKRVVVDGTPSAAYDDVRSLLMTDDGAHYAFIGMRDLVHHLVIDGVEGPPGPPPGGLSLGPNGQVAYIETEPAPPGYRQQNPQVLVVDGMEVTDQTVMALHYDGSLEGFPPGASPTYAIADPNLNTLYVAFSPDGKRFAYTTHETNGARVVIDGQPGPEYRGIANLHFSPDGSRVAYIGRGSTGGSFVVVDGEELPSGSHNLSSFEFSPDGQRYWYELFRDGNRYLNLDGEESEAFWAGAGLIGQFSPDGSRFAYIACHGYMQCEVSLDGQSTPPGHIGEFATGAQSHWGPRTPQVSRLAFSPDGSRLAYVAQNPGVPGGNSVFVDGEALGSGHAFAYPVFSPDSRHFAAAVLFNQQWQIAVDGRAGPAYREIVAHGPNAVRFLDDDTLRVLAVKDGSIYRVVLDLGG